MVEKSGLHEGKGNEAQPPASLDTPLPPCAGFRLGCCWCIPWLLLLFFLLSLLSVWDSLVVRYEIIASSDPRGRQGKERG